MQKREKEKEKGGAMICYCICQLWLKNGHMKQLNKGMRLEGVYIGSKL